MSIRVWTQVRSEIGRATIAGADEQTLAALRAELRAARLADAITKTVDAFPPLSDDQKAHLAALLTGGTR